MRIIHILPLSALLFLTISCGPKQQAESTIKCFLEANLKDTRDLNIIQYGEIDSTRYLNDSIIEKLRKDIKKSRPYKKDIKFSQNKEEDKLIILRVKYNTNGKDYHDTYYLDKDMTRVIAIKSN